MYKFKRIFAIFFSVLLLSLIVGDAFISTNDIRRVYATGAEVVAGAAAADAIWEFAVALLAATGLGGAAIANKDAVIESYMDYLDAKWETKQYLVDQVINIYDSATDTIRSIPIDELMDSLKNYHDSAVDSLTGIYAQYCPELIGITKEFVSDVAAKNITIAGVTDSFSTSMTAEAVAQQWSGEPYTASFVFHYNYVTKKGPVTYNYDLSKEFSAPICGFLKEGTASHTNSDGILVDFPYNSFKFYQLDRYNVVNQVKLSGYFDYFGTGVSNSGSGDFNTIIFSGNADYPFVTFSYSADFPIFSSYIDVEAYLKGTGAVTGALNYSTDITDSITDNNDLPTIGNFAYELWERIANANDHGIGAYGSGVSVGVNDWADDIPWVGLGDLQDLVDSVQDVYDKTIAGILDGTYDLPLDVPDYSYGDAWVDVIDRTWDDLIDNPVNDPSIDVPDNPSVDIPDNPAIDIPTLGDLTKDNVEERTDSVIDSILPFLSDIGTELKKKFPFSIPWDIYSILSFLGSSGGSARAAPTSYSSDDSGIMLFSDDDSHGGGGGSHDGPGSSGGGHSRPSGAPVFQIPFQISQSMGIEGTLLIDLEPFQVLSDISRTMFTCIFCLGLIRLTLKVFDALIHFFPSD